MSFLLDWTAYWVLTHNVELTSLVLELVLVHSLVEIPRLLEVRHMLEASDLLSVKNGDLIDDWWWSSWHQPLSILDVLTSDRSCNWQWRQLSLCWIRSCL